MSTNLVLASQERHIAQEGKKQLKENLRPSIHPPVAASAHIPVKVVGDKHCLRRAWSVSLGLWPTKLIWKWNHVTSLFLWSFDLIYLGFHLKLSGALCKYLWCYAKEEEAGFLSSDCSQSKAAFPQIVPSQMFWTTTGLGWWELFSKTSSKHLVGESSSKVCIYLWIADVIHKTSVLNTCQYQSWQGSNWERKLGVIVMVLSILKCHLWALAKMWAPPFKMFSGIFPNAEQVWYQYPIQVLFSL